MLNLEILSKIQLFNGLSDSQLLNVQKLLKEKPIAKGEFIIKEGSYGEEIYILTKGTVRVTKKLIKGIDDTASKEKVLVTLDGSMLPMFGENGMLGHFQRTANVFAYTDCITYTLHKTAFEQYLSSDYQAAYQIMRNIACVLSGRLEKTDNDLVKLATAFYIAVQQ